MFFVFNLPPSTTFILQNSCKIGIRNLFSDVTNLMQLGGIAHHNQQHERLKYFHQRQFSSIKKTYDDKCFATADIMNRQASTCSHPGLSPAPLTIREVRPSSMTGDINMCSWEKHPSVPTMYITSLISSYTR